MTEEFLKIPFAINLLQAMEANPEFGRGLMPTPTTEFLSRLENADPADADLSEDDSGPSWGHCQFTGGAMTMKSVLTSWQSIGSTSMACKLIAATIKTCKVARHICFKQGIKTTTYLADCYLTNLIEELFTLWKDAGGVSLITFPYFTLPL
jgi:hypothetical protein